MPDRKTCFVIMPNSDVSGYEPDHWNLVFSLLIEPVCRGLDFDVTLEAKVHQSHNIVLDIVRRLAKSDLVICDLSSVNPNVMYELGVRHVYELPVVLLKDERTRDVFDVSGIRYCNYDSSLRHDLVEKAREALRKFIENETEQTSSSVPTSPVTILGLHKQIARRPSGEEPRVTLLQADVESLRSQVSSLTANVDALRNTSLMNSIGASLYPPTVLQSVVTRTPDGGLIVRPASGELRFGGRGLIANAMEVSAEDLARIASNPSSDESVHGPEGAKEDLARIAVNPGPGARPGEASPPKKP